MKIIISCSPTAERVTVLPTLCPTNQIGVELELQGPFRLCEFWRWCWVKYLLWSCERAASGHRFFFIFYFFKGLSLTLEEIKAELVAESTSNLLRRPRGGSAGCTGWLAKEDSVWNIKKSLEQQLQGRMWYFWWGGRTPMQQNNMFQCSAVHTHVLFHFNSIFFPWFISPPIPLPTQMLSCCRFTLLLRLLRLHGLSIHGSQHFLPTQAPVVFFLFCG